MEAESGIGKACRAAPESIIEGFPSYHAAQWYQMHAESGIGMASSAAPEGIIEAFASYHAAKRYQLMRSQA